MSCLAALVLSLAVAAQDTFTALVEQTQAGRLRAAQVQADALSDPLERAQGRLYVQYAAGDLAGALRAGLEGLEHAPDDPWLLERCATLALQLRASTLANDCAERLAAHVAQADAGVQAEWQPRLASVRAEAAALAARQRARDAAQARAHWTLAVAGGCLLLALVAAARAHTRAAPA